jgi:hypothetical protein
MAYIGKEPADSFISFAKQDFTTSATTSYTLDNAVTNENELALFINFVRQEPTTAYTASGTTLTLTSATASTDDMYCVYLGQAKQTVNAPDGSVGNSQVASTIITGQTAETSVATDDTILIHDTSASALRKMTRANFVSGIGGDNTPAFQVKKTTTQSLSNTSFTKVTWDAEDWDTDSAFASDKFTVPSGEGGKYYFQATTEVGSVAAGEYIQLIIYVGGGSQPGSTSRWYGAGGGVDVRARTNMIINLSASDYVEVYAYQNAGQTINLSGGESFFRGFKLIGV